MSRYGKLVCLNGPRAGQELELSDGVTTVGRSPEATLRLDDQFASRQHAEIIHVENAYQVRDLHSKNGVVVDGRRLPSGGTAWLSDGIEVQFASTRFRFYDPSATVTSPALIAVREPGLRVDITTRQVYVDGQLLDPPLSVKQFDLLWFLYQNRGRVVSKDEIAQAVWPEAQGDVYDANIDRMVSRVRSRIEPNGDEDARFIQTVRGYGYQLKL
ncbi:MAG: winged helix-turn-helix domain-containing protein [Caldilineaceae bacterium]|nr:winged helix-turn-helix domain-containing protein [Caldilineaceae bacterium]